MLTLLFGFGVLPVLVLFAMSVIIIAANEANNNVWATVSAVLGAIVVIAITKSNPLPWLQSHVLVLLLGLVTYFALGVVWGFFKWYLHNISVRDRVLDGSLKLKTQGTWNGVTIPLKPKEHKSRIIGWMTYWPWSATWFILNDPIRRAWNAIYNRIVAKLEAVSNHVFKTVIDQDITKK
jgi:hypothetical protein